MRQIKVGDKGWKIEEDLDSNFTNLDDRVKYLEDKIVRDYYPKTEMDAIIASLIGSVEVDTEFSEFQMIQKNASFTISGAVTEGISGDIEVSHDGTNYTTIATVSDGEFAGSYAISNGGIHDITIRSKSKPVVKSILASVLVGRLYLVCGDSNSVGRGINPQVHGLDDLVPVCYREDDVWREANDGVSTKTNIGSQWPLLARLLTEHFGEPVGFVTTGTGSKDIIGSGDVGWYEKGKHGYNNILVPQAIEAGGKFEAILLHLGPNAALSVTSAETYKDALMGFVDDLHDDVDDGIQAYVALFGRCTSTPFENNAAVRQGVLDAISEHPFIDYGPNLLGFSHQDNVHPRTDIELAITAGRWFAALKGHSAPSIVSARYLGAIITVTVDQPLDESATPYTPAMWRLVQDGVTLVPTSVTRLSQTQIRLQFASDISGVSKVLRFVTSESHSTAVIPTGIPVELPTSVHGITSVSQPLNPVAGISVVPNLPTTAIFNGSSSYVEGTPVGTFPANGSWTLAVTLTRQGIYAAPQDCVFSRGSSSRPVQAFFDNDFMYFGSTAGWKSFPFPSGGPNGRWTFVHDGSRTTFAKYRAFLNGEELAGTDAVAYEGWDNSGPLRLGLRVTSSSFPLNGKLFNPKVWNRLCLPSDIDQTTGLILNLESIDGTTWKDSSPSGTNFTLLGGAIGEAIV